MSLYGSLCHSRESRNPVKKYKKYVFCIFISSKLVILCFWIPAFAGNDIATMPTVARNDVLG